MKSIMLSIQPKYCELIANGKKTVEVRKTKPKLDVPFKCYIYCTQEKHKIDALHILPNGKVEGWQIERANILGEYCNGKVIGEFVCDYITGLKADNMIQAYYNNTKETCLTDEEITKYANGGKLYYWHITDLVIYDKLKVLREFKPYNRKCEYSHLGYAIPNCKECHDCYVKRPPQSYCFVEELGV